MLRIGTRGSALALWQATFVQEKLRANGHASQLVVIRTTGDLRTDVPLAAIGGKGLFLKELESALDASTIDLAVHSLKDVPSILEDRFVLAAYVDRADPRDAWIATTGEDVTAPSVRVAGTSSPRRRAQLLALRRGLDVRDIRGNVDTRIRRMQEGEFDAIVLAAAGLERLGRSSEVTRFFDASEMTPAAGQGIIAVETLRGSSVEELVQSIDVASIRREAETERGVLQTFGTMLDCHSSIAVHARTIENELVIDAFLSDLDATQILRVHRAVDVSRQAAAIDEIGRTLRAQGAVELLERGHAR
jgi:hydroxymethylbilane synthase